MKRSMVAGAVVFALAMSSPAAADDKADVTAAMNAWKDSLGAACGGGAAKILPLYADDGVLWGTLSATIRDDRAELEDYFVTA